MSAVGTKEREIPDAAPVGGASLSKVLAALATALVVSVGRNEALAPLLWASAA